MKTKGFTLIELMVVVVIIGILAAIAIPNFIRMQNRAKESDVKSVAHASQLAVEDFKTTPGFEGIKPTLVACFRTYLPTNVLSKKNPFNQAETYNGAALQDGGGFTAGHVGYVYVDQSTAYNLIASGQTVIVLTLQEGS